MGGTTHKHALQSYKGENSPEAPTVPKPGLSKQTAAGPTGEASKQRQDGTTGQEEPNGEKGPWHAGPLVPHSRAPLAVDVSRERHPSGPPSGETVYMGNAELVELLLICVDL